MSDERSIDEALEILLANEADLSELERAQAQRLRATPEAQRRMSEVQSLMDLASAFLAGKENEPSEETIDRIEKRLRSAYEMRVTAGQAELIEDAIVKCLEATTDSAIAGRLRAAKPPKRATLTYVVQSGAASSPTSARLDDEGGKVEAWRNTQGNLVIACRTPAPAPPPLVLLIPRSKEHSPMAALPDRSGAVAASGEDVAKFQQVEDGEYLIVVIPSESDRNQE